MGLASLKEQGVHVETLMQSELDALDPPALLKDLSVKARTKLRNKVAGDRATKYSLYALRHSGRPAHFSLAWMR